MESLLLLLAEQGHWFVAFLGACVLLWARRVMGEMASKFRGMLEAHDAKNDEDFKEVRSRLHDISDRLARIEGALIVKRKDD